MTPVTVVVGLGGGGIGNCCARKFAAQGHRVAVLARSEDKLQEMVQELTDKFSATGGGGASGGKNNFKYYVCDATVPENVKSSVEKIVADFGRIDTLIYNAGMGMFKGFDETSEAEYLACLQSNSAGLFSFVKSVKPIMLSQESLSKNGTKGVIGVTGATASWRGMPFTSAFAPSKFALRALCQSLTRDLGPQGIHVFHSIIDGVVDMPKTHQWLPNKPHHEFLDPNAIADMYYFVASQPPTTWTTEFNVCPSPVMKDMVTN